MKSKFAGLILGLVFCFGLNAQGLLDAFSQVGPQRLKDVESAYMVRPEGFDMIFGPEPLLAETPGGKINLKRMAARQNWFMELEKYEGLIDVIMEEDKFTLIVTESNGAIPVAWQDKDGRQYVAIVGLPDNVLMTKIPLATFQKNYTPSVSGTIVNQSVIRGACFEPLADRFGPVIRDKNTANCEAKKKAETK